MALELAQNYVKGQKKSKRSIISRILRQWDLQIMVWPGVIFILIFCYIPMWGILFSFQNFDIFKGFLGSDWVGLKHFKEFFQSPDAVMVIKNTLEISLLKLVIIFPAPIIFALILNEVQNLRFKKFVQTITYLPHFISWVIVGGLISSILSVDTGSLNMVLLKIGIIKGPVNWLSIPDYFRPILIGTGVWKSIGFGSIVYLAAIAGINPSLYEAADVDGCSRFKKTWYITLPSIAPIISIFLVLNVGNLLNAGFEDILVLTNNGGNSILRNVSEVIDIYVYKQGLRQFPLRYSYATAVGLFKGVINVMLLVTANKVSRKLNDASLW